MGRAGWYGLGWNVNYDEHGGIRWSHSGAFGLGTATSVDLLPGGQLGIVVLTNAQPIGLAEAVGRSFLDVGLFGTVQRDWIGFLGQAFSTLLAPNYGTGTD